MFKEWASLKGIVGGVVLLLSANMPIAAQAATVIFNSLDSTPSGYSDGVATTVAGPIGASFTAPSNSFLTDVKVLISLGATATGSFDVSLFSDNAGVPGTSLGVLGTTNDTALTLEGLTTVDFSSFAPIALTSGTRYWINVVSSDDSSSAGWSYTFDTSGTGVATEFFYSYGGPAGSNTGGPYQMKITTDTAPSAVPEPTTIALLSLGLVGIGIGKRRRKLC